MKYLFLLAFMTITASMGYAQLSPAKSDAAMEAYEKLASCLSNDFYKLTAKINNYSEIKKELNKNCVVERDRTRNLLKERGIDQEILQMRIDGLYDSLEQAHKTFVDTALERLSYSKILIEQCNENKKDEMVKNRDFIKSAVMQVAVDFKDEKAYENLFNTYYDKNIRPLFEEFTQAKLPAVEFNKICSRLNDDVISFKMEIEETTNDMNK